jgi:radical SAM superfamily enzyme YgiQ (UPF0313 family)
MTKVAFVELPIIDRLVPLASGYMEAYARKDPKIREGVQFEKLSIVSTAPYEKVRDAVLAVPAEVYAFSCYVWNMGTIRRLLPELLAAQPNARIILGGPQVMEQGKRYLSPELENVVICNGEGERTFTGYLSQLLSGQPDLSQVKGLSFYRGGELITTEAEPRIRDLEEIPSPYLEGVFPPGRYAQAVIETNRGCPFQCTYCFWGAATGAKVFQFSEERVRKELEQISKQRFLNVFIADANWGMLKRDVELSRYLADCRKRYGAPLAVYMSSAKNSKDRVQEITHLLAEAGLISTQAIALQTMSPETLKSVKRDNIKSSSYMELQKSLNEKGINSYLEMIWPLPGETLESFEKGLGELCETGADSFQVHRLLLMNNVEMDDSRVEFAMVTEPDGDPASEAEFVVANKWVTREQYLDGVRYVNALTALYNSRGLWTLGRYLQTTGKLSYPRLFRDFAEFCRPLEERFAFAKYCEDSIRTKAFTHYAHPGHILHLNLHAEREQFDLLLEEFLSRYAFWQEPEVRLLFEMDLLNRPYVYRNTPITAKQHRFEQLTLKEVLPDGYLVELPSSARALVGDLIRLEATDGNVFHVNHRRAPVGFNPKKSLGENLYYASDASTKMRSLSPEWKARVPPLRKPGTVTTAAVQANP